MQVKDLKRESYCSILSSPIKAGVWWRHMRINNLHLADLETKSLKILYKTFFGEKLKALIKPCVYPQSDS